MVNVQPHEVDGERVLHVSYCTECGSEVETDDGLNWWHVDFLLNPKDEDDD